VIKEPIESDDYLIFNLNNDQLIDKINYDLKPAEKNLLPSTYAGGYDIPEQLISDAIELPYDSYIADGMRNIVKMVNNNKWKLNFIDEWSRLTLLYYRKKGHHLGWHCDDPTCILSTVLCLSNQDEYTGANFELKERDETVKTFKFGYGDCIVFRTGEHAVPHRVTSLVTGVRRAITGFFR